ncbi:MAG: DNA mismatch repair endonuclease MutL [Candidatus Eisenbacteria bacterium]|nr:DNA mismatch repair endonuclease MutL [Candidatus Eisenbacteria bacterium]
MKRTIRRLAADTASRIAAGEVIDRPLSALKEILENAFDAGARSIEIRVERALDHAFQVADDGTGIPAAEIELALERHATSKLTTLDDLDRLESLGFRGEALPSIAAVSRLKLVSAVNDAEVAALVRAEGGIVVERGEIARAPGTTVEVRDVFFNVPARRKFLSGPAGELRAATRMIESCALAFPAVAIRLTVDGRERFHWPAARDLRERCEQLWSPRHAAQRLLATGERDGVHVTAMLGLPEHARATREGQVFLVNRRWVQSPLIAQALRQAYGNLLPPGRFPAAVVWLTVPPARLDVNVHPTKREVRFADDDTVFGLIAGACAKPLASLHPPFTVVRGGAPEPAWADRVRERPSSQTWLGLETQAGAGAPGAAAIPESADATAGSRSAAGSGSASGPAVSVAARAPAEAESELWQLHRTYILAPVRGGLVIIDQHAAHERILYEEALARLQGERGAAQQLLFPVLVDLSRDHFDLLLELGPQLQQLGWDLSPLGPPTVVIQGVPSGLRTERPAQLLQDMLDGYGEDSASTADQQIVERIARSFACHAATRAGDALTREEMRTLVDRLFATSHPHGDPHGRVTFVRLDLDEFHRRFGRL